jgi:hypothetical protein
MGAIVESKHSNKCIKCDVQPSAYTGRANARRL